MKILKIILKYLYVEKEEIDADSRHEESPHELLQKKIAEDITIRVHGQKDFETAVAAVKFYLGNLQQKI